MKQRNGTLGARLFSEQAWELIIHFFYDFHENSDGLAIFRAITDTTIDQPIKEGRLAVNWMYDALEDNLGQTAFGVFAPPDEIHIASNFDKTGWTMQKFPRIYRQYKSVSFEGYSYEGGHFHVMRAFNHGGTGLSSVRQFKHLIQSLKEEFNGLSGTLMTTDSKPFKPLDGTDGKWRFKKAGSTTRLGKFWRACGWDINGVKMTVTLNDPPKEFPEAKTIPCKNTRYKSLQTFEKSHSNNCDSKSRVESKLRNAILSEPGSSFSMF